MLFLHEVHQVAGRREEEFEAVYRDGWMPSLAKGDDARLLYFLHHAHGTGRAYNVVTLTAIRDGAAWEQLMLRLHDGDLRPWAHDVDALRHGVAAKMLVPVPWSPLQEVDLEAVPTGGDHPLTLFMEDTAWPYEGGLEEYLEAARTNYAPSLAEGGRTGRSLLELQAVLRPAWGAGRWREVVLWQKVTQLKAITPLVTTEVPPEHRAPGTWMHDALDVRDDWESKLLRTTAWSPLF
ncbi:MAG TPA: hypothetical protein VGO28_12600 [Acidimicrobiia bacterium]|jgi:hypothetical protein